MPGLGQGFKGYNRRILLTTLIKIRNTRHTPLGERLYKRDEDRIALIRTVWDFSTRNVEPLAQTWIRCECFDSCGHNGLTSPKHIQSSRARAGLNRSTLVQYKESPSQQLQKNNKD